MSRRIVSALRATLAAALLTAAPVSFANAADMIAPGPYVAAEPASACAQPGYLGAIERRFRIQTREVHHMPDLSIVAISNIRENRYVPARAGGSSIDRLYCSASAALSDGRQRTVWYMVEYGQGFAGVFGDNVEFCVTGFDRWNVYDGSCRVVK